MDLGLVGKTALVCASSSGIGRALAIGLAVEGANVSILARGESKLRQLHLEIEALNKGQVMSTVCDLSILEDIERVVQRTRAEFGPIQILINNQGGPAPGQFHELAEDRLVEAFQRNLLSVWRMSKLCIDDMVSSQWGRILNVLSVTAKEPILDLVLSNIMRPAVVGLSKSLAKEYGKHNITVNSILPASVHTSRTESLYEARAKREGKSIEEIVAQVAENIPAGRIASPEEFVQLALFLCGKQASYVNGAAINIDGGASKSLF